MYKLYNDLQYYVCIMYYVICIVCIKWIIEELPLLKSAYSSGNMDRKA